MRKRRQSISSAKNPSPPKIRNIPEEPIRALTDAEVAEAKEKALRDSGQAGGGFLGIFGDGLLFGQGGAVTGRTRSEIPTTGILRHAAAYSMGVRRLGEAAREAGRAGRGFAETVQALSNEIEEPIVYIDSEAYFSNNVPQRRIQWGGMDVVASDAVEPDQAYVATEQSLMEIMQQLMAERLVRELGDGLPPDAIAYMNELVEPAAVNYGLLTSASWGSDIPTPRPPIRTKRRNHWQEDVYPKQPLPVHMRPKKED